MPSPCTRRRSELALRHYPVLATAAIATCAETTHLSILDGRRVWTAGTATLLLKQQSIAFRHLCTVSQAPELPLHTMVCFIKLKNSRAEFKRLYLMRVLLAGCSVFSQFTQWHNRISREISELEDVIDRILLFLIGLD